jgi:hypothetical protein
MRSDRSLTSSDVRYLEALFENEVRRREAAGIPTSDAEQAALALVRIEGWAMLGRHGTGAAGDMNE